VSTTFGLPDPELRRRLAGVMERYHQPLHDAEVRVAILLAVNDDGDAVVHGGYPALATIKIVSLKDRVLKQVDAELLIDERAFRELTYDQQEALLDHELTHLELGKYGYKAVSREVVSPDTGDVTYEPTGETKLWFHTDDLGRPKLKSVKGDANVGDMFKAVIFRHGSNAIEFVNIERAATVAHGVIRERIDETLRAKPSLFETFKSKMEADNPGLTVTLGDREAS
jgi:hypothetical protein